MVCSEANCVRAIEMAKEYQLGRTFFIRLVLISANCLVMANSAYWFGGDKTRGGKGAFPRKFFPSNTSCIYDLEIPKAFFDRRACNETCVLKEKKALSKIHEILNGDEWLNKWPIRVNKTSLSFHCDWFGVLCDYETKHVIALDLRRNRLRGAFEANLQDLKFLLGVCFGVNRIYGKLEDIVSKMPEFLLRLSFSYNQVSGVIPPSVRRLSVLSKMQLTGNLVSGPLPHSLGDLQYLTVLSVGETNIFGSVPKSLSKLRRIWFLDLEALGLDGDLSIFQNLTSLEFLHLSSNRITGEIPADIGQRYPYLRELLLQNNLLNGNLPRSIGLLKHLTTLNVARNSLTGTIPLELGNLDLRVLILSSNLFNGFDQGFTFNFTNLKIFMASDLSLFSCNIKTVISFLMPSKKTIMQVDISNSNLYGDLPDQIFSFKQITFLKLASNQITGYLPVPNDNIPYFTLLDLRNNNLSGEIPTAFSRLLMLLEIDLRGNKLMRGPIESSFLTLDKTMRINERETDTCPSLKFSHNHGSVYIDSGYYHRKYCHCKEHYYGHGGFCYPCMKGGRCPGPSGRNMTAHISSEGSLSKMFLVQGFWPFPNERNVKSLHKCPTSIYHMNLCVPDQICDCTLRSGTNGTMMKRSMQNKNGSIVLNKVTCNQSCLCATGHFGRFCSQCRPGYYREGIRCFACPGSSQEGTFFGVLFGSTLAVIAVTLAVFYVSKWRIKVAIVLAIVQFFAVIILVWKHYLSAFLIQLVIFIYAFAFNSYLENCIGLFKTTIFYIQLMDTLVSVTDTWPKTIYSAQRYASSAFNLSFSSLACPFPKLFTLLSKNFILFILPILCSAIIWFVFFSLNYIMKPDEEKYRKFNYNCRKYCLVFIDIAYFPLVRSSMSVIVGCREIESVSFMKNYAWLDCGTHDYLALKYLAIAQFIIYVLGIPAFLYCPLLYHYRNQFASDESPVCKWLGHILRPYKPRFRPYLEVVMVLRRLVIAILLTSMPANQPAQTLLIAMYLIAFIIFQALAKPYEIQKEKSDVKEKESLGLENAIDIFMLFSLLIAFICVGLSIGHKMHSFTSALFLITLITNALFILTFCLAVVRRLFPHFWNDSVDPAVPSMQQPLLNVSEDCFAQLYSQSSSDGYHQ